MGTMIQIRDVPDELHRTLKKRAVDAGMSLSYFLKRELEAIAGKPTWAELTARIDARPPAQSDEEAADIIRSLRDAP